MPERNKPPFPQMTVEVSCLDADPFTVTCTSFSADGKGTLHVFDRNGPLFMAVAESGWSVKVVV